MSFYRRGTPIKMPDIRHRDAKTHIGVNFERGEKFVRVS